MNLAEAVRVLGPLDVLNVRRDPLLRWLVFYPLGVAAVVRWGEPWAEGFVMARWGLDASPYLPLLMSLILMMTPMLAGMVVGFLLLDQRDDRTLAALRVSPMGLGHYLLYRVGAPMLVSLLVTMAIVPLTGLMNFSVAVLISAAVCAAPLAPIYALVLAAFASNKVQGFAIAKAMGAVLLVPLAAYFLPTPWQWLCGLDPFYWPAKLVWLARADSLQYWVYFSLGCAYEIGLVAALLRHYRHSSEIV